MHLEKHTTRHRYSNTLEPKCILVYCRWQKRNWVEQSQNLLPMNFLSPFLHVLWLMKVQISFCKGEKVFESHERSLIWEETWKFESEDLAGEDREGFRALIGGHKEQANPLAQGLLCGCRCHSGFFKDLRCGEGNLWLAELLLDWGGQWDAETESLLGFLETRMRRLFVRATGMGHGKIQDGCFYPWGETLFGLDSSQWHRVTESFEFVHLPLGQSLLETVSKWSCLFWNCSS